MRVVFDATTLIALIKPDAANVLDSNKKPVEHANERVNGLVLDLKKRKSLIVVPTPVIAEAFVRVGHTDTHAYLNKMRRSRAFIIEPFCEIAAIELSLITASAIHAGDKKSGSKETWAKVKFDRQIVSVAKVHNASCVYTDDRNLTDFAVANGLNVVGIAQLPIPEAKAQLDWVDDVEAKEDPRV